MDTNIHTNIISQLQPKVPTNHIPPTPVSPIAFQASRLRSIYHDQYCVGKSKGKCGKYAASQIGRHIPKQCVRVGGGI